MRKQYVKFKCIKCFHSISGLILIASLVCIISFAAMDHSWVAAAVLFYFRSNTCKIAPWTLQVLLISIAGFEQLSEPDGKKEVN